MEDKSFVDQRFGDFGRKSGAMLKLFLFAAEPKMLGHGYDGCPEERKCCRSDSKGLEMTRSSLISTWERPRDVVENDWND